MDMPRDEWFILEGVNPDPWAIGPLSTGRKGKQVFPRVGRNQQLWFYQQAVKESMTLKYGQVPFIEGPIELWLWFWRSRDAHTTSLQREQRKHDADTTNLYKGTEDALQGILYANDKDVLCTHGRIMEQSPEAKPRLVIRAMSHNRDLDPGFPKHILLEMQTGPDIFEQDDEVPF
jgi:hypothetical protein